MKKGILTSLGLAAVLTLGLASVNEYRNENVVDAAGGIGTLVTDASTLAVGDQIVIAAVGTDVALSTTQNSNNRGQANFTKEGNTITFGEEVQVLTLETGSVSDTYAFNTGNGYLYAASSSKNYYKLSTLV